MEGIVAASSSASETASPGVADCTAATVASRPDEVTAPAVSACVVSGSGADAMPYEHLVENLNSFQRQAALSPMDKPLVISAGPSEHPRPSSGTS